MKKQASTPLIHRVIPGFLTLSLIWGLLFAAPAAAKEANEIEYGYPGQSIFVATINSKGEMETPMKHLARALLDRAGVTWRATSYPARRLFRNLESGATQFSILVRATSLLDACIFSQKPVYGTHLNVYHIGDKPAVTRKQALAGKHIITIRGYSYGGLLAFIKDPANNIVNEVAGSHRAAFEMLKTGRADYLVDYASAASHILTESSIPGIRSAPIGRLDIFLVVSKAHPGARELMDRLEAIAGTLDVEAILRGDSQ